VLEVSEIYFNPQRQHNVLYSFVDEMGLPEFGSIYAKILIRNIGYENGNLEYTMDEKKVRIPIFLDRNSLITYFPAPPTYKG
jgi:hypothetical protein